MRRLIMAHTNVTGKLRTKWVAVLTDEFCFRDTVHGFLAWAFASLATAALLTSEIGGYRQWWHSGERFGGWVQDGA